MAKLCHAKRRDQKHPVCGLCLPHAGSFIHRTSLEKRKGLLMLNIVFPPIVTPKLNNRESGCSAPQARQSAQPVHAATCKLPQRQKQGDLQILIPRSERQHGAGWALLEGTAALLVNSGLASLLCSSQERRIPSLHLPAAQPLPSPAAGDKT